MGSDLTSGVFGILGAIVGGGATLAVGVLSQRADLAQAQSIRQAALSDVRRKASTAYLTGVNRFLDAARDLNVAMDPAEASSATLTPVHERYRQSWEDSASLHSAVQIAGPAELASAATRLRLAMGGVGDVVDARYRHPQRHRPRGWDDAYAALDSARAEFIAVAQRHFAQ